MLCQSMIIINITIMKHVVVQVAVAAMTIIIYIVNQSKRGTVLQ